MNGQVQTITVITLLVGLVVISGAGAIMIFSADSPQPTSPAGLSSIDQPSGELTVLSIHAESGLGEIENITIIAKLAKNSLPINIAQIHIVTGLKDAITTYTYSGKEQYTVEGTRGTFGANYLHYSADHTRGMIKTGDVVVFSIQLPRDIDHQETVYINVATPTSTSTTTVRIPSNTKTTALHLYP